MSERHPTHAACARNTASLKVRGNTQGIGNRIGWYLTVAAFAESLGHRTVYTNWPNAVASMGYSRQGNRDYSFRDVSQIVAWPGVLRFLEDTSNATVHEQRAFFEGKANTIVRLNDGSELHSIRIESIPYHPRPYVNDYVPECAWQMLVGWARRGHSVLPHCITRFVFLRAYRKVQSELRQKVPLCNPAPKTYVVVHIRRGDKAMWASRERGSSALTKALANASALPTVIAKVMQPVHRATGLPFLLLTDGGAEFKAQSEREMKRAGLRLQTSGTAANLCAGAKSGTTRALADFFAMVEAAAVVVIAPKGVGKGQGLQESSFATVAALAGGAPHLTPVPYAFAGKMAFYQQRGNDGHPLEGIFYLEGIDDYIRVIKTRAVVLPTNESEGISW